MVPLCLYFINFFGAKSKDKIIMITGDSSKENSPRPDDEMINKKDPPTTTVEKKVKRKEDRNMGWSLSQF